jgi:hypothetical protein
MTPNLAEGLCWEVACRDDARVARRRYRQQVVDGVYRLDAGALLDDCFHFLENVGVMALLADVDGPAIHREMVPCVPSVLLDGLKTRFGLERIHALPALLCSDAARMRLVGFKAQQARHGVGQRGTATRQGERAPGPICPDTLAQHIVKLHVRDREAVFKRVMWALAQAGVLGAQVTGIADGTDLATMARAVGGGQVTRKVRLEETRGRGHASEGTLDGWKVLLVIDATTQSPLAVKVGPIDAHEPHGTRAWVTQARSHLAGDARLHTVVFDQGFGDGPDRWWLDPHGITFVGPTKANMAVTADARAQAAAPADIPMGRRVQTVRHGQGSGARTAQLETAVGGITGLTTDEPYGTPAPGRDHNRRDVQSQAIHAVVVRKWHGRDAGPGGKTVLLTNASVQPPLQPFDDDDDRRLIDNGCSNEATQPWAVGHPPQNTARAVRVPGVLTVLMCALATASRLQCAPEATAGEPVGWPRWRRQLLEQSRDDVIVFAQGDYGLWHLAEYSRLLGAKLKDVPPGIGTLQDIMVKYELTGHSEP